MENTGKFLAAWDYAWYDHMLYHNSLADCRKIPHFLIKHQIRYTHIFQCINQYKISEVLYAKFYDLITNCSANVCPCIWVLSAVPYRERMVVSVTCTLIYTIKSHILHVTCINIITVQAVIFAGQYFCDLDHQLVKLKFQRIRISQFNFKCIYTVSFNEISNFMDQNFEITSVTRKIAKISSQPKYPGT